MAPRAMSRHPDETEQLDHLADRFGLHLRPDFGPLAERHGAPAAVDRALAIPFYALLHSGNVVPREAIAQRGRLIGSLALNVAVPQPGPARADALDVARHAQTLARVLMAELDAFGAIYSVQTLDWEPTTGNGILAIEVATGRGVGDSLAPVRQGDLSTVLNALLEAVLPGAAALAVTRDPVDLRDDPQSSWRWIHPIVHAAHSAEFETLHREMAFEVLSTLVQSPDGSCRPLKSVPRCYLEVPGLEPH